MTRSPVSGWWWSSVPGPDCAHEADAEDTARGPVPADLEDEIGEEEIVRVGDGWVKVIVQRDGTDAGLEILDLHYQARRLLGETPARPEPLDGIPCRECEQIALERAEPPSDPTLSAMHSRCSLCGAVMTKDEFDQHVIRYKSWAESVPGLACKRCQKGEHSACSWPACDCRARGHVAAA